MNNKVFQKLHIKQMSRLLRRFAALTVAGSMLLSTAAMAAGSLPSYMEDPIRIRDGEEPTITIESNAVVDRWYDPDGPESAADYLTGELEVVIRVKSGCVDGEWQGFNTLGVALKYSSLLEPYQWTDGENPIDLAGTDAFEDMVNQQTLKDKNITTAMAQVSGVNGEGGYLYFEVEAQRPIVLKEDTVLAVVTFKYDLDTVGPILAEDAAQWLTPVQSGGSTGGDTGDTGDAGGSGDEGDVTTRTATDCLIQFATVDEIMDRFQPCELVYNSAYGEDFGRFNTMYYSEKSVEGMEAVDPSTGERGDWNRLELSTNYDEIEDDKVNFSLVNKPSYNDGGLTLDDLATVLFFDWDDTLLGVLIVPRDGDARSLVNTYVQEHFIYFDENDASADLTQNTNYSSLSRKDNYRGKYPTTPMADGTTDGTDVDNGELYPLTNKLDYVFLKRPMEQVVTTNDDGTSTPVSGQWKQTSAEGEDGTETAVWDDKYPYIHGWAIVDYSHPENTWTTIGVGELSNYTGTLSGGYNELNGVPAQLTVSGQEFEFANFDFRAKNDNSLESGSIYAVKAVYEPGENLLHQGYFYRMISEPYYNKLNNPSAAEGGAYSVDVSYERSYIESDGVHGIARAREPVIRMETTSDIRWEEEDLVNATGAQQSAKTKTTYSKVAVDNLETIGIQLVLSARHNKVNYYIMDAYGASFVTGGERSAANTTLDFLDSARVIDNYNYKVDDSDLNDIYFDPSYMDREGSYGFVLNGTLNNLAQKATEYCREEIDQGAFNSYLSIYNFNDINLRSPDGENIMIFTWMPAQNAFVAAVREALAAHDSGNDTWWDVEHDCAQFTYHQLQLFVMNYISNGSATLLSAAAADAQIIPWCHLHETCAAESSGKPTDFRKLVQAAFDGEKDKLQLLVLSEAENMAHFRADANGTPFDSMITYADVLVAAVQGIGNANATWDQIQDYIIRGGAYDSTGAYSRGHYWWYDGSTGVSIYSLSDAVAIAKEVQVPVAAPGDSTAVIRYAKFNQLEETWEANDASEAVDRNWVNITENLCVNNNGEKFATFEDFRTKFLAAVSALGETATWYELQYHILHGSAPTPGDPELDTYWWHNGKVKISNLATLISAAQDANNGDFTIMDMLTADDIYSYRELHFRNGFNGTDDKIDSDAELSAFKSAVMEFVKLPGVTLATSASTALQITNSWNQLQYWLIHPGYDFESPTSLRDISAEATYYWWREGGTGEDYTALLPGNADSNIKTLMEAVYRSALNGNPQAYSNLNAAALEAFRLVPTYAGTEDTWADLTKYDDSTLSAAKGDLDAFIRAASTAGQNYQTITWRQIQHYLLTKTYLAADDAMLPSDSDSDRAGYWWRTGDQNPNTSTEPVLNDFEKFMVIFNGHIAGTVTDAELKAAVDEYFVSDKMDIRVGTSATKLGPYESAATTPKNNAKTRMVNLAKNIKNKQQLSSADGVVDWYVLQYYVANNVLASTATLKTPAEARAWYENTANGTWAPDYATGASMAELFAMFAVMDQYQPVSDVEVDEETGIITVTTTVETPLEDNTLIVVMVTTVDPTTGETTTVATTTLVDSEGNVLSESTTVTTTPAEDSDAMEEVPVEPVPGEDEDQPNGEIDPAEPGDSTEETEPPTEPEEPSEEEGELPDVVDPPEETERPEETEEPDLPDGSLEEEPTEPDKLDGSNEPEAALPDQTDTGGKPENGIEGGADMIENEDLTMPDIMAMAYRQQLAAKFSSLSKLRLWTFFEPMKLSGMNVSRWSGPGTLGPPTPNVSRLSLDLSHIFTTGRITA